MVRGWRAVSAALVLGRTERSGIWPFAPRQIWATEGSLAMERDERDVASIPQRTKGPIWANQFLWAGRGLL